VAPDDLCLQAAFSGVVRGLQRKNVLLSSQLRGFAPSHEPVSRPGPRAGKPEPRRMGAGLPGAASGGLARIAKLEGCAPKPPSKSLCASFVGFVRFVVEIVAARL
jgi:hypothetical protein